MIQSIFPTPTTPTAANDSIKAVATVEKDISMLRTMSFDDLINKLATDIIHFAIHLAIAILVFYVGKFIIKKIYRITETVMARRRIDTSLATFVLSLINMVLYFILVVTVIGILGIETSSFIALFASAGVAVGMALSGTLQNFAGGVLILLLKPYRIGDYIETQGYAGTVTEIQIFNTIICTPDNKSIIIPNGGLSTGTINNWSREDYRRVEWVVGISYGDSVERVRTAVQQLFAADPDVVLTTIAEHRRKRGILQQKREEADDADEAAAEQQERQRHSLIWRMFHRSRHHLERSRRSLNRPNTPRLIQNEDVERAPAVTLSELADSSVNVTIRAWVPTDLYWPVFFRYNELFYTRLPELAGISFPFPQMDVHLPGTPQ